MRRLLTLLTIAVGGGGCLSPTHSALTTINTVPPVVIGSVPSLDGGSACLPPSALLDAGPPASLPSGVPAQVTFSEDMDINTLRPGIGLFQCPCPIGQEPTEVPLTLSVITSQTLPDYSLTQGIPFTVQIQPAADGNPCLPDGGTYGCFSSALYLLQLRTLLTDPEGNALQQDCQINFEAL
jgi:hypothetical protein